MKRITLALVAAITCGAAGEKVPADVASELAAQLQDAVTLDSAARAADSAARIRWREAASLDSTARALHLQAATISGMRARWATRKLGLKDGDSVRADGTIVRAKR